jgi:hypothetical protein
MGVHVVFRAGVDGFKSVFVSSEEFTFEKLPNYRGGFVVIVRSLGEALLAFTDTSDLYTWAEGKLSEREHSQLVKWCLCEGEG